MARITSRWQAVARFAAGIGVAGAFAMPTLAVHESLQPASDGSLLVLSTAATDRGSMPFEPCLCPFCTQLRAAGAASAHV